MHGRMPLPKEVTFVTFDVYGTLIDWETGVYDAFAKEAEKDGYTLAREELVPLFMKTQQEIKAGSYELYAEVLRRTAVQISRERPRTSAARSPRSSTSAAASTPTRSRRPSSSPSARSSSGKVLVKGKIASAKPLVSRTAHGRGYIAFSRFDTKAKRWKRVSRYSKRRQDTPSGCATASTRAACGASRASSSRRPATRARARRPLKLKVK